jgi:hypothetical protein
VENKGGFRWMDGPMADISLIHNMEDSEEDGYVNIIKVMDHYAETDSCVM